MMSSNKRIAFGLLILGLLVIVYVVQEDKPPEHAVEQRATQSRVEPADVSKTEKFAADTADTLPRDLKKAFVKRLQDESHNMAKIDENSKETEQRLIKWAAEFTPAEIEVLREMTLNISATADERFLAVYLLGYNSNPASQKALWNVAKEPVTKDLKPDSILYHQELVLRAQALLGLNRQLPEEQRKSQISEYAANTRELFLSRLAYRLSREPADKASIGP